MANRQPRNPGSLSRFNPQGTISSLPSATVVQDDAGRALAALGGSIGSRLKKLADGAAAREGEEAGRAAGAQAGSKFVEKLGLEARGAARGANTRAKPQTAPSDDPSARSGLSETPLQLRNDGTIRGEAFDRAALQAYGWRMQTGLTADLAEAYKANEASPGGYETAIAKVRETYLADEILAEPGPLRETFEQTFTQKVAPSRIAIRARHEAAVAAAARQAATESLEAQRQELERDAYNLGAIEEAGEIMGPRVARLHASIDGAVAAGTFTRAQGNKFREAIDATVINARTAGTFDALETPGAQKAFALSIMDDYAAGRGPFGDMSLDQAQSLSDELYRKAVAAEKRLLADSKAEIGRLEGLIDDDIASIALTGQGVDAAETGLTPEAVETLLGEDGLAGWRDARKLAQRSYEATAGMELETESDIAARLEALTPEPGSAGFEDATRIQAGAVKKARQILEDRETDPLGQAHSAGLVELTPIDVSSPDALAGSLAARKVQAATVADTYGTPPVIFRAQERTALANALMETPELLPSFAASVDAQLGDLAPQAFAELFETGPTVAHAAGVASATGSNAVTQDVAAVLQGRRDKTLTVKMPSDGKMGDAAGKVIGPALSDSPDTRAAVQGVARLLFEREANALGFDPDEVTDEDSAAFAAYSKAVERALGARVVNGEKWGGLSEVNGRSIVAPSFMPAGEVQAIVNTLSQADLDALAPINSGEVPITASQIRRGNLVTIGDGLYRVAMGDPDGFEPQWIMAADGSFWTLDVAAIRESRADRPQPGFFENTGWVRMAQ